MAISLNDVVIPSFVLVNDIQMSILPSISQNTLKVSGKAGEYDFGNEIDTREIRIDITIIATSPTDLRVKTRQLGEWLFYNEYKKLVILEDSSVYYMAKFTGSSDMNDVLKVGQGTINFICEPYAYNIEERVVSFSPTENVPYAFENNGSTDTFPRIEFTFTDNATEFSIVSDDSYLYFGKPVEVEVNTPVEVNPLVLGEAFANMNGWTSGVSLLDGAITGGSEKFISNGYSVRVDDFGEGAGWKGASAIKSLNSPPIDSFKFKFRIGLHGTKIEQLSRIHLYGLDVNGQRIFAIEFRDGNVKAMSPYARWIVKNKEILATYGVNNKMGYWTGFTDGFFDIARRKNAEGKNVWAIWIARYDPIKKTTHHSLWKEWVDKDGIATESLASVQIHIGAYGEAEPVENLYIQDLKVFDVTTKPNEEIGEVPYIFRAGDELVISNEDGGIWLNGEPFYEYLDPSSKFIKFEKGINGIWVTPLVVTNGIVTYRERWL